MEASVPSIEIYTDGFCEPNPGRGGYAAVLLHPKGRREISGGFRLTTNNRMELIAAVKALEILKQRCNVVLHSDSKYLVDAMRERWFEKWRRNGWWRTQTERVANVDIWEQLVRLCEQHTVEFRWVKGHAGIPENERCDALAMAAAAEPDLQADGAFESPPAAPAHRPDLQEGEPCRKCGEPVVKQTSRKKPKQDFYYEYYLWCPKCNATFAVEEARRKVEQGPSLW